MIELLLFFVMAIAADFLAIVWHSAREKTQLIKLGFVTAALEFLSIVPMWLFITQENVAWAIAAIIGSVVGAVYGCWRSKETKCDCCYCSHKYSHSG